MEGGNSGADMMVVERERVLGVDVGVGRVKAIRMVVGEFHVYFLVIVSYTCSVYFGTRFSPEEQKKTLLKFKAAK